MRSRPARPASCGTTRGNAFYLSELARDACAGGRLVHEHGVWMWRGGLTVPPRLADLLGRRFDGLSPAGLDALGVLVLGEPLPIGAMEDIATVPGVVELEACRVMETAERDGDVWCRFAHPMLAAAAAGILTATRRRRLAGGLLRAPGWGADVVRRAMWQLDAGGPPDVELLRSAAVSVFLTQPALAQRLVERALPHDAGPDSALLLADAHAELGEPDAAREAVRRAGTLVRTDEDRLRVRLNEASLTAFTDRRPDLALGQLAAARAELPGRMVPEIDSMVAQITVFSAEPAKALDLADALLARDPPRASAIRATSVRVIALALVDRAGEALEAARGLVADVAAGATTPYASGIAQVAVHVARFVQWADQHEAPATDWSGRWPVPSAGEHAAMRSSGVLHPLFEGGRRLLEGQAPAAVAPLPRRRGAAAQRRGPAPLRGGLAPRRGAGGDRPG